jgi:hypothetical protein
VIIWRTRLYLEAYGRNSGDMKSKTQQTINHQKRHGSTTETHIKYVTSVKIKRSRAGQGKPSRFIAGHVAPLEVHRGKGLSDQNQVFSTPDNKVVKKSADRGSWSSSDQWSRRVSKIGIAQELTDGRWTGENCHGLNHGHVVPSEAHQGKRWFIQNHFSPTPDVNRYL